MNFLMNSVLQILFNIIWSWKFSTLIWAGIHMSVSTDIALSHSNCAHTIPIVAKLAGRHWSSLETFQIHLTKFRKIYGYGTQCLLLFESFQGWFTRMSKRELTFKLLLQTRLFKWFLSAYLPLWDRTAYFPLSQNTTEPLSSPGLFAFMDVVRN